MLWTQSLTTAGLELKGGYCDKGGPAVLANSSINTARHAARVVLKGQHLNLPTVLLLKGQLRSNTTVDQHQAYGRGAGRPNSAWLELTNQRSHSPSMIHREDIKGHHFYSQVARRTVKSGTESALLSLFLCLYIPALMALFTTLMETALLFNTSSEWQTSSGLLPPLAQRLCTKT